MCARILDAAIRVLAEDGALAFTTTRVADEAGISVGSLYQYFPNKHALALAVHQGMVEQGWRHVQVVLDDPARTPRQKIIDVATWFFAAESDEAQRIGPVLDEVGILISHVAADPIEAQVHQRFGQLLATGPGQGGTGLAVDLLVTTLEAVGKAIARRDLTRPERQQWATATATMLCDHLGI